MAASDRFAAQARVESPVENAAEVSPSDSAELSAITRAIWVGTAGDVTAKMAGGQTVTFANMSVGWHPIRVRQILDTGTDAEDIVAVW